MAPHYFPQISHDFFRLSMDRSYSYCDIGFPQHSLMLTMLRFKFLGPSCSDSAQCIVSYGFEVR